MGRPARRIVILGSPGSGKTTLARRLHARLGIPVYHLDDEYWGPQWSRPTDETWCRRQAELAKASTWLIEGNYFPTIELRAAQADFVVVLDAPALLCLWRIVARAWRIRRGALHLLPRQVAMATGTGRPQATKDFGGLVRLVLGFRRRYWRLVLRKAGTNPEARVVIGVVGGAGRIARCRAELAANGMPAEVLARDLVEGLVLEAFDAK